MRDRFCFLFSFPERRQNRSFSQMANHSFSQTAKSFILMLTIKTHRDIIMISKNKAEPHTGFFMYRNIVPGRGVFMEEKVLTKKKNGMAVLILIIAMYGLAVMMFVMDAMGNPDADVPGVQALLGILLIIVATILIAGLKVLKPQEALVLTLFGKYIGTLKSDGFYFVNPFCTSFNPAAGTVLGQSGDVDAGNGKTDARKNAELKAAESKRISLKIMTLSNAKQKVNDVLGNPVEVGVAVMWRVTDTAKAVFNVDNYKEYLSLQCDTAVRDIVKIYPYDVAKNVDTTGDGKADDGSLRGSTTVVAERIRKQIQDKVEIAGLEIVEARITYLAYAPEIASVMLQRQQASAVVDARKMIVDGAVGMVEMALEQLKKDGVVDLDEERKAAMVSNLMVVLCGNHDAQPVVNSGSLY